MVFIVACLGTHFPASLPPRSPVRGGKPPVFTSEIPSEIQLQPKLDDARGDRCLGDEPECWGGPGGIRREELSMVECIKELSSEFDVESLHRRSLNQGDVG